MISELKNHTSKFMRTFGNNIRLIFSEGNIQITKDDKNQFAEQYSHMSQDGTIDLRLDNPVHTKILDIFLSSEQLLLNGVEYKVLNRIFSEMEPVLFFQVERV